ncbi:MAG: type pilus assembly protein PilN [Pseudomonadota bacterium]|nr:type pilus assembly protein PilN [Pseudomonadota bacterium]MDQ5881423.1 type pilus assembly protein PilN [Pseudomonadota bacterium]MDQ5905501.1 type pilus assembly protein PilN [Pseudomonadota bacterium]MDQ5906047.1 type pilus assembly protein PilN [Pseudomonadota bacterium]MDQ5915794.1 type pilus assembly protein PilN [Pseudomonadota bacterium]
MIRINLLPHREEKRKAKRQQFFVLTALVAVLAGLIVFLGYSIISGYITTQDERNDFLKKEIAVLDKQLEEIKRLKEQTAALLSRKQIIESLQSDRAEAVQLLNEMVKQMPEGVYLKSLKQEDRRITMTGYTQSNARVSTLMRNLEASPWVEAPKLIEIKAVTVDKRRVSEFGLTAVITRVAPTADSKSNSAAGGNKK